MPTVNGDDATRAIREAGNDVPIITLAGLEQDALGHHAAMLGFNNTLTKPLERSELIEVCAEYLRGTG